MLCTSESMNTVPYSPSNLYVKPQTFNTVTRSVPYMSESSSSPAAAAVLRCN